MDWSINRIDLGRRIVKHSNCPFIKGNFSLSASGLKGFSFRKPVSLVFKVYPCGLRGDENESLTLEVVVECRASYLLSMAKVNLEITLSMDRGRRFISTRTWQKPLKTFLIHDFLPHEVVTHSYSRTLDFKILAFIAFDESKFFPSPVADIPTTQPLTSSTSSPESGRSSRSWSPPTAPGNDRGPRTAPGNHRGPPTAPGNDRGPSTAPGNHRGPPHYPRQ
jgi:hypothetical protein